ncbi:GNAT family N-acetyltransferase [Thermodesulfobacteriota bacterium]
MTRPTPNHIKQITDLYRKADWWEDDVEDSDLVTRIVEGSHCFLVALNGEEIIGMGRCISDGASDGYIQDITVKNEYRRQGIGTKIIEKLVVRLNGDGLSWVGLIAERGSHGFYSRIGFEQMPDSVPMLRVGK